MRITKETIAPEQSTIFPPETIAPSIEQGRVPHVTVSY
jgi:hypothetical protein